MKKSVFLVIFLAIFSNFNSVFANFNENSDISESEPQIFWLDLESLDAQCKNNPPTIQKIESSYLLSQLNESQILEKFQPKLEGDTSHFKASESSSAPFPTTSPISKFSLGITKDFSSGMSLGVFNVANKQKYGSFGTDARNSVVAKFTMDLYKDIFGRTSRSEISYYEYEKEISKIQSEIDKKIFLINAQKLYFALILNNEAIKISKNLLKTAQKQEIDAKNRYKKGAADYGEVARQSSQVSSRQTQIYNLYNNQELLILNFKELFPSISDKKVEIANYDFEQLEGKIKNLIGLINGSKMANMDYTNYDEIIKYIEKSYKEQKKITKAYSDVDLELYSSYEKSDNNNQISNTYGDVQNYGDERYQVGVRLNVPLGKTARKSEMFKKQLEKSTFLAKKQENLAKIAAYHTQTIENIKLLKKGLENQKNNAIHLKESLKSSQKKYNQARIGLRDLIEDQNLYLQSLLTEIEIKSLIINQTLDYNMVFTNIEL